MALLPHYLIIEPRGAGERITATAKTESQAQTKLGARAGRVIQVLLDTTFRSLGRAIQAAVAALPPGDRPRPEAATEAPSGLPVGGSRGRNGR